MAALILPRRYTQQPQQFAPIDWNNPFSQKLALLSNASAGGIYDLAFGRFAATSNGLTVSVSPGGVAYKATSNAAAGALFADSKVTTSTGDGLGDFAYFFVANPQVSTTKEVFVGAVSGTATEFYIVSNFLSTGTITAEISSGAGGVDDVTATLPNDGKDHIFLVTRLAGTFCFYIDGRLQASIASARAIWKSANQDAIGGYFSGGNGAISPVPVVGAWNRGFDAREALAFSDNLWQILKFPSRRLWIGVSGGVQTRTVTPSGGITFSGTSTTTRGRTFTPTGGITLSGSAAQSRGKVQPTPVGGLIFSGTAPQTRGRTITPSGGITFSGTAQMLRGVVKTATGGILFAGSAPVSFTSAVQSLIVTPVGGFVLSGSAAVVRGVTKVASGGIRFAGTAGVIFNDVVASLARRVRGFRGKRRGQLW